MPISDTLFAKPTFSDLFPYFDEAGGVLSGKKIREIMGISAQSFLQQVKRQHRFTEVEHGLYRLSDVVTRQRTARINGGIIHRVEQYIELTSPNVVDFQVNFQKRINAFQTFQNLIPKGTGVTLSADGTYSLTTYPCRFISNQAARQGTLIWEHNLTQELLEKKVRVSQGKAAWEAARHYTNAFINGTEAYTDNMAYEVRQILSEQGIRSYNTLYQEAKPLIKTITKNAFNYGLLPAAAVLSAVNIADAAQKSPALRDEVVNEELKEWASVAIGTGIGAAAAGLCTGGVAPLIAGVAFTIAGTEAAKPVVELWDKTLTPMISKVTTHALSSTDVNAPLRFAQSSTRWADQPMDATYSQLSKMSMEHERPIATMELAGASQPNVYDLVSQAFSKPSRSAEIEQIYQNAVQRLPVHMQRGQVNAISDQQAARSLVAKQPTPSFTTPSQSIERIATFSSRLPKTHESQIRDMFHAPLHNSTRQSLPRQWDNANQTSSRAAHAFFRPTNQSVPPMSSGPLFSSFQAIDKTASQFTSFTNEMQSRTMNRKGK